MYGELVSKRFVSLASAFVANMGFPIAFSISCRFTLNPTTGNYNLPTFSNDQSSKSERCLALVEVAAAVAALLHLLDLLLPQLGPPRRPLNNPHEVPAPQLTLQPTPSSLVLPPNRGRVLGFLDRWPLQLRKLRPFLCFVSVLSNCQV